MSAETLRRAASLMRERAEKATPDVCPEWTRSAVRHIARNCEIECWHDGEGDPHDGEEVGWDRYNDAPHIASWHPAVALAVADWLDGLSIEVGGAFDPERYADVNPNARKGIAVARAYLGEQP